MRPIATVAATLALCAAPALAGGLQLDRVAADARWIVHVDLEGIKRTTLWQTLDAAGLTEEIFDDVDVQVLDRNFGIHPFHDLKSATLYGRNPGGEDVVAVLVTTARVDGALEQLSTVPGYRSVESGGLEVHAWQEDGEECYVHVRQTGENERMALISQTSEQLFDAIRVVAGSVRSQADVEVSRLSSRPRSGALLQIAAIEGLPGMDWMEAQSEVFGLAREFVLEVGEDRGVLFANATVVTEGPEEARNLYDVLNGLMALGRMALSHQDVPDGLGDFMNAFRFEHSGDEIVARFEYASRELIERLSALGEDR